MRVRRKRKRNGLKLIAVMVMIICGVVLYRSQDLNSEVNDKRDKVAKLNEQLENENERTVTLEEKKAFQSTKRYIEEIARTKLGLVYPDEYIVEEESLDK